MNLMMSPQLSSDSQPLPRFLSAVPQDAPRVGHGLGLLPASELGGAEPLLTCVWAWTAAAVLLSPLSVRFGDESRPASDALGRAAHSPSRAAAPVLWLNICKLPSVRLWARSHCQGGFGSPFRLASCLVQLSARGASFGSGHLAPRDSLSWDQRAGCVSCCDEMS